MPENSMKIKTSDPTRTDDDVKNKTRNSFLRDLNTGTNNVNAPLFQLWYKRTLSHF